MKSDYDPASFAAAVYDVVAMIPRGRATSYGAIARAVGHANMSRMVGRVMGVCGESLGLPAHRVVNSQGQLSARECFGAPGRMAELLRDDGVEVVGNRIVGWRKVFWDPSEEINI